MTINGAPKILLDLIASSEAGPTDQYNVVYGHHEHDLPKPITSMTLTELMANQLVWGKQWGSSAAGRYQFMPATLQGLIAEAKLTGRELFTPTLQDDFGYRLLLRRGYSQFITGTMNMVAFGKGLAQEWASFPVLADTQGAHRAVVRGQSYYAGDGLNKAGLTPETIESTLARVLSLAGGVPMPIPAPIPKPAPTPPAVKSQGFWANLIASIIRWATNRQP